MKVCPLCGESLPDEARFCPGDGSLLVTATDPYIGKVFDDQFEVREVCGRGSMGTVYKAWQKSVEREVAIKVLRRDLMKDASIVKRFEREARAAARLSHPNIITVFTVGQTDDGIPFLAMEFVKGFSLARVCEREGPLPPVRAIHIGRQITSALTEAHNQDVVHRDLKPENILLSNKAQAPDFVKVLDFGIAKILHGDDGESQLTQTGAIFGTPHYLAPEQASGGDVDHRTDLYALGVILFEVMVGRLPFPSDSGMAVLVQHIKDTPPRPRDLNPSIPQPLEDVILTALEKSPDDRFQSAAEFGDALGRVVDKINFGAQTLLRVSTDAEATRGAMMGGEKAPSINQTRRSIPSTVELVPPAKPEEPATTPAMDEKASDPRTEAERSFDEAETRRQMKAVVPPTPEPEPEPEPPAGLSAPEPEETTEQDAVDSMATTVVEREDSETALAVAAAVAGEIEADDEGDERDEDDEPPAPVETALDDEATDEVGSLPGQSTIRMANTMLGRRRFVLHGLAGLLSVGGGAAAGYLYWRSKQHGPGEEADPGAPAGKGEAPRPEDKPGPEEADPGKKPEERVPGKDEPSPEDRTPEPAPDPRTKKRPKKRRRRKAKPRPSTPAKAPSKVAPVGPDPRVKATPSDHGDHGDHGDPKPEPIKKIKIKKKKDTDLYELVD